MNSTDVWNHLVNLGEAIALHWARILDFSNTRPKPELTKTSKVNLEMNQFSKSWEIHSDLLWSHSTLWGGSLLCWNYMYLFMYVLLWASIFSTILSKVNELCPAIDEIVPCSWFSLICSSVLSQPPTISHYFLLFICIHFYSIQTHRRMLAFS